MLKQILFIAAFLCALGVFSFTVYRLAGLFRLTRSGYPVSDFGKRFASMMKVAIGQTRIFRRPVVGLMHAIVFWGFCVILFGSIEMIFDGILGIEKSLSFLGPLHTILIAAGDIFSPAIAIAIIAFLVRRIFMHIRRFEGIEMKNISHVDAAVALTLILLLMISLSGMNTAYLAIHPDGNGIFPASEFFKPLLSQAGTDDLFIIYETCWWIHILLIFIFANILPYSKHFHVFMSVPNVFLSRLDPLGKMTNMESITREVKLMLNPETTFYADNNATIERFGVKDAEDVTWKNYFDSLSCTECGRCTSMCPANITGKKLSPRKVMMDIRARMKEKGPEMLKHGKDWSDNKSLLRDYITEEELWACTTCNSCARECPVNINQPSVILDLRRYLVLEEASAPGELKTVFNNIENNGAPWQFSSEDRLLWTKDLEINIHAND